MSTNDRISLSGTGVHPSPIPPTWRGRAVLCAGTALAAFACIGLARADADTNAELNRILEANAASAAHARMCDQEPLSERLKSNTMMLLAVNGIEAGNIQLGSLKFNSIMRREIETVRKIDCAARMQEAGDRLTLTQGIIERGRRDAPQK
jgi:hypothetical protein